jgi:hypothetical protein
VACRNGYPVTGNLFTDEIMIRRLSGVIHPEESFTNARIGNDLAPRYESPIASHTLHRSTGLTPHRDRLLPQQD